MFNKLLVKNTLRMRILLLVLGAIILVGVAFSFFSISALSDLGNSTKTVGSDALRKQIEETLLQSTRNNADTHSDILLELANESAVLADYMSELYSQPDLHHNPDFWSFDEQVMIGDGGQLFNSDIEPSSIYAPASVAVDDKYKTDLEISAQLNLIAPSYLKQNPNIIAVYFIHQNGKNEFTRYFPNISLGLVVPPDFRTVTEPFFELASPAMNPEKGPAWIPVYDDPAGRGIIVTVSSPVYTANNEFVGIVGIDYRVASLSAGLEENQYPGGYAFVIDQNGQSILLREKAHLDIFGAPFEEDERLLQYDTTKADDEFLPIIEAMINGETGVISVDLHGEGHIIAYSTIGETGWSVGNVVIADQVLGVAQTLEADFANQTNSLIYGSLLPTGITVALLAIIAGSIFAFQLGKPLETLTKTAKEISAGDLNARVPVESSDEVGQLGKAFNQMADELRTVLNSLEQKVADRTKRLESTAELSNYLNSTQSQEELIYELIDQLKNRFGYADARIYLRKEDELELVGEKFSLKNRSGTESSLSKSDSQFLVTKAMSTSQIIRRDFDDSISEAQSFGDKIAVPIAVDQKSFGVLEITNNIDKFDDADINFFNFLANQVASAFNNVQLFEETVHAKHEAEVANKAKTTFLSTISHELKTPLNAILNFADFVKAGLLGEVNDQQIEAMGHIVTGGEHLLSLIDDSLDISRIEAETIYLDLKEIDLAEMVGDVAGSTRALINEKPIELRVQVPDSVPTIVGDKKRIMQILTNLTSNAVKYTEEGSITIKLSSQDNMVKFSVQDTGVGIHPEDYDVIFAPFGRARHSLDMESSTGLGLAVTRDLVKVQNGIIGFESELNIGSTFYVELPVFNPVENKIAKELVL